MGLEAFTVLAILEARDRASEVFGKVDASLDKFSQTMRAAAAEARAGGAEIDQGLLQTASGADAIDLADARVSAAQSRLAAAMREQSAAEQELLATQTRVAGSTDAEAAADDRAVAAADRLSAAQRRVAGASRELTTAQKIQGDTAEAAAAKTDAAAGATKKVGDAGTAAAGGLGAVGRTAGFMTVGMAVAGAVMVKAAGNFQDATTHLTTDAGESAKNLAMVQAGILKVSTETGQSALQITNAMYHIESAGYHGAAGLTMLKIAAEGARVGGANLDTVSKTLVGTMNAYGMSASHSASMMNQLIATTAAGDMRMQDLASSLSSVAPLAAAAHIQFAQVGGAIATMTSQGMSADQATQDLAHTIRSLSNPNNVAIAEMAQMGIQSQDVSQHLGQRGLTGTIEMLTKAITQHMGPSGKVIMNAFNQSKAAAQDASIMFSHLGGQAQVLAKQYMDGAIGMKTYRKEAQALGGTQGYLATQFETTFNKSRGFNALLSSGAPGVQTYTAALAKMMGGATGLNTALMLSGSRMPIFQANTAAIAAAAKKGGDNVDNWSRIQGTFNFKLQSAKVAVENTGIAIGTALLPAATSLLKTIVSIVMPIAEWTAKHKELTLIIFGAVVALTATVAIVHLAHKAFTAMSGAVDIVHKALQKLGIMAKETATIQEATAGEAAAAEDAAAVQTSDSWVLSAAKTVGAWIAAGARMIAQAAVWVATNTAKVAVVVAENIAAAATTAAAWIAANAAMLLGIGLIVLAIGAAVLWIVTHWKTVVHVFDDVMNWLKQHWPLVLAILTGPIGLAVYWVIKHWKTITKVFDEVIAWLKDHWPLILAILTGPVGLAVYFIVKHWDQIVSGTKRMWSDVIGWFKRLPGDIIHAVGDLGHLLWNAGVNIIKGLIGGILSMAGSVGHAIGSIVTDIRSWLPFSPAKKGPLSGRGSPDIAGRTIGSMLASGIDSSKSLVSAAAGRMAAAVKTGSHGALNAGGPGGAAGTGIALTTPVGGGGAAGGTAVTIDLRGAQVMTERDMDMLVSKIGRAVATKIGPQAGLKWAF